ncbi:MAG: hypothetical protein AB8B56_19120 [Crocinitomicaceae bacterium]
MEIVISLVVFGVILVALRSREFFQTEYLNQWIIPSAYVIKCAAGMLFLQFYVFQQDDAHLKNDAGAFYHEAQILNKVFYESPDDYVKLITGIGATEELSDKYLGETNHWDSGKQAVFHDNRNIIRAHALIDLISQGSIVIHMLLFALLSLIGTFLLFQALTRHSEVKHWLIFAVLLLLPNVLFWSSGILKEPFIVFGIGAVAYGVTVREASVRNRIIFTLLGLFALTCFKPYILILLLASGVVYLIYRFAPKYKLVSALGGPLLIAYFTLAVFPNLLEQGTHRISRKQFDFSNVGRGGMHVRYEPDSVFYYFSPDQYNSLKVSGDSVWLLEEIDAYHVKLGDLAAPIPVHLAPNDSAWILHFDQPQASSFIEIMPIDDQPMNLINAAPKAVFNALLRPFPNDPGGSLKYLAFLETLLLFGLLAIAFYRRKGLSMNERAFLLSAAVFCVLLALLIGWTTPVLGAIHRYRLPIQLAMLCCAMIVWSPKNLIFKK